jgi:hypothetical protein
MSSWPCYCCPILGVWQDEKRSSAGSEIRIVVSLRVELILVAVLVISQIEVHSGGCVRAGREVVVAVVVLVSMAIILAALTLATEARARNLIYMDTHME